MSDFFRTPDDYETFIYILAETFPVVVHTTLVFVRVGSTLARISGEVLCQAQFRLLVRERVSFERLPLVIDGYGYEVWQATKKGGDAEAGAGAMGGRSIRAGRFSNDKASGWGC